MESEPLVSIITPSYNQAEYIEETLQSVMRQDYPNIEHIVLDGGSTDGTIDILEEYEPKYNLRWVSEPDEGQSDAVNKGFEKANGSIIGWLNSDDVYFGKRAISKVVATFRSGPQLDVVYGDDVFLSGNGNVIRARKLYDWDYERMLRWGWWGWTPASEATFYRRSVIDEERLDETLQYILDFEYFLRLGEDYNLKHIGTIVAGKRKHEETKSSNRGEVTSEAKQVMEKYGYSFGISGRAKLLLALLRIQLQWVVSLQLLLKAADYELAFPGEVTSLKEAVPKQLPVISWLVGQG